MYDNTAVLVSETYKERKTRHFLPLQIRLADHNCVNIFIIYSLILRTKAPLRSGTVSLLYVETKLTLDEGLNINFKIFLVQISFH